MDKPLRILAIVNVPWDPRLGAARVWIELCEEWRKAGHIVEKFCLTDAFPEPAPTPAFAAIRTLMFPSIAAKFIRNNAGRFDVVDALIGTVPYSKRSIGFNGLLVARSVGLYHLYEKFEQFAAQRWPRAKGSLLGRPFYSFFAWRSRALSDASVRHCDLVNVPNSDEVTSVRDDLRLQTPVLMEPYGVTPARADAMARAAASVEIRSKKKKVVFIGMWSPRKGAKDWRDIIGRVRRDVPDASFLFLGTMIASEAVWADLEMEPAHYIEIVPQFAPGDLPQLLADCAVGAFPSYIEGFGMAVVEQLAAGLPTVAYDVPGPRDILRGMSGWLIAPGDTGAFAEAVTGILTASVERYDERSRQSIERARRFSWRDIAQDTALKYHEHLTHARR
jgi:glycosyltransferase involved in cell wall biosynthesis